MATTRVTSGCPETGLARVNLLAERDGQLKARRSALRRAVGRLVAVLAVGAAMAAGLFLAHARVTELASSTSRKLTRVDARNTRLASAQRTGRARQARTEFLSATRARHGRWVEVMAVAGQAMPGDIWVRRLVVKEAEGHEMLLVEGYSTGLDLLPAFMRTLGRALDARETHIEQVSDAQIDGRRVVRFSAKLVLRPSGGAESKPEPHDE